MEITSSEKTSSREKKKKERSHYPGILFRRVRKYMLLYSNWNLSFYSFIDSFSFLSFFPDCLVISAWCNNVKYSRNRIDSNKYINNCIPKPWQPLFKGLKNTYYDDGTSLLGRLAYNLKYNGKQLEDAIEPQMPWLFKALELVEPEEVRVVILGQDPTP